MKAQYQLLLVILTLSFIITGCEDSFVQMDPISARQMDDVAKNADGVTKMTNAIYGELTTPYNYALGMFNDQMSDDAWSERTPTWDDMGTMNNGVEQLDVSYEGLIDGIAQANLVLDRTSELMDTYTDSDREIIQVRRGEAFFLRGLIYFNLVRLWGEVPLLTQHYEDPFEAAQPRSSIDEIYAQIKSDIDAAIERLPEKADTENWRANLASAYTLKAKVHLTLEEWSDVVQAADNVINLGTYSLVPGSEYGTLWGENRKENNNSESIFEIEYDGTRAASSSFNERWHKTIHATDNGNTTGFKGSAGPHSLVQAVQNADSIRRYYALLPKDEMSDGIEKFATYEFAGNRKYYLGDATIQDPQNHVVFRYAEVLMMKAEALNEMGQASQAVDLLNQIRNRVNYQEYNGPTDKVSIRHAIWFERRLEFTSEQKRFFDLNRWGVLLDTLRTFTGFSDMSDQHFVEHDITGKQHFYLPLPQNVLDLNAKIEPQYGY
ncbi:MAG: RagB/SusD family nutrient uptake outer membrane protein [Balneolaceae bacterium]|nr:RagB/SusD family nutrient uptake outer membrane protein [Balneolaceae bacterium]